MRLKGISSKGMERLANRLQLRSALSVTKEYESSKSEVISQHVESFLRDVASELQPVLDASISQRGDASSHPDLRNFLISWCAELVYTILQEDYDTGVSDRDEVLNTLSSYIATSIEDEFGVSASDSLSGILSLTEKMLSSFDSSVGGLDEAYL